MDSKPIEDYGVIGDLSTVALVGSDGSIDFLCLPRFDSPTVFGALLDPRRGGKFQISPAGEPGSRRQFYLPDSNVLLTRFLSPDGVAEVSDFMPAIESPGRDSQVRSVVRRAKTVRGEVRFRMLCQPRFDYARAEHEAAKAEGHVVFASKGKDGTRLRLWSERPLEIRGGDAVAEFTLRAGEHAAFVLEIQPEEGDSPCAASDYVAESFKRTVNYWRRWIGRSTYAGRWREQVARSALVLKLLTSAEHGSILAAPTFGLPEEIGGGRNWDYRYTWIRDASLTTYAFMRLGMHEEARTFFEWLSRLPREGRGEGPLQVLYRLDGRRDVPEEVLDHLDGYRKSKPVRIGNEAAGQLQLDIYGELLDSVYLYDKHYERTHHDFWEWLVEVVDWLCENWRRPDESVWEVRGGRREFLYSRVLCWVAFDRAVRIVRKQSLPAPLPRWIEARDAVYRDVFESFWDAERKTFVQYARARTTDASALILPLVKFIGPKDPRWLSTLHAIEEELVEDSLVYRYRTRGKEGDGIEGSEGTFSICTFWYVECLSRSGDLEKARLIFEKMLGHASPLGLYAEQIGSCGEQLGNFPQAFTHLALISAAYDLDRRLNEAGQSG